MEQEQAGIKVVRRLRELGHQAYYAGGCVRDRLLGRPANDVDVATSARPEEVQAAFKRTIPVGVQFGIVVVRTGGTQIEVATFRSDGDYQDGRHPESVEFTDAQTDALRRDFTINGLFFDPIEECVFDYVGGEADLRRGLVRAIGQPTQRFDEDKLRILRAPRFAAVLGFRLEEATAVAARERAHEITQVSQERIAAELNKILASPARARGIGLTEELGLLEHVLPEARPDLPRVLRTLALLPAVLPLTSAWAALLQQVPAKAAEGVLRRLRMANKDRERVLALLEGLQLVAGLEGLPVAAQKRHLRRPEWQELPLLVRATALAGEGDLEPYRYLIARQRAFAAETGPGALHAAPLLMGSHLRTAGLKPGPAYGRILRQVEDAQLEGRVRDEEEALRLALELAAGEA